MSIIGDVLGRRITFEELSPDEFRSETQGSWPRPVVDMLLAGAAPPSSRTGAHRVRFFALTERMDSHRTGLSIERTGPAGRSPLATEVMVAMRDGIRLATDVYLPDGDSTPGPAILTRLPYDKNGSYAFMPEIAGYFMRHGYRVVVQDVRGKFRSEGETLLFVNEADDGYDTLEWITKQPWSNGIAGMWGDSYYGFTQWAAASTGHPALRAIVPRVTGTRLGELAEDIPGTHTREVEMSAHRMYPLTVFHDHDIVHWDMDWSTLPYHSTVEKFFATVGTRSASYDLWFPYPVRLRRYPRGSPFRAPAVPVLMTIGWWDNCAPWQWQDHAQIQAHPQWALGEYLLIEAIDHENNSFSEQPWRRRASQRSAADRQAMLPRYLGPAVEFFDVFLRARGAPTDIPRVRWQLVNAGPAFRTSASWPPAGSTTLTLYPRNAAAAARHVPGGALDPDPPAGSEDATWNHDPTGPVPSLGPDPFSFLAHNPDDRHTGDRPDVLVFTAAPVTGPLDLVGPVSLRALVRSDGPEMDLFARLLDLAPDGAAHLIARGQLTVLAAGYGRDVAITMGHLGYRLLPGHALRLTLASSDAPEFVPHWGSGGNRWAQVTATVNTQAITLGGPAGARLQLSIQTVP